MDVFLGLSATQKGVASSLTLEQLASARQGDTTHNSTIMQKDSNRHAADIILRSSDKESFHSWKIFLSMASPVFSDMFTLPQADTSNNVDLRHDGPPVIDLPEDSCTLGHILTLCHPPSCTRKQFKVNSVRELGAVLEAAMKYDMENLRCVALEELSNPLVLREDPVGVYALACQHECHEAARLAAKHTLALPTLVREYVPVLEKIHAGKLCHLLLYREECMKVACSLATDHTWIMYTRPLFGCGSWENEEGLEWTHVRNPPSRKYPRGRLELMPVHKWWMEYMRKSGYALQRWPHGDAVKDEKLVDEVLTAISTSKCKQCKALEVSETFRSFVDTFAGNIERRVAEVRL